MPEPAQLDVNRVLTKLQQKLNEANSTIIILEAQLDQLAEEREKCTCDVEEDVTYTPATTQVVEPREAVA